MPSSTCLARASKDLHDSRRFSHCCICPEGALESTKTVIKWCCVVMVRQPKWEQLFCTFAQRHNAYSDKVLRSHFKFHTDANILKLKKLTSCLKLATCAELNWLKRSCSLTFSKHGMQYNSINIQQVTHFHYLRINLRLRKNQSGYFLSILLHSP